ncbi:MAG: tyrosine-type recombinase/integrase [Candidatus Nitrosopolaris sp.]
MTAKPTIPNDDPINQDTKSDAITKYITNINAMSKSTARAYHFRLQQFARFTSKEYDMSVDNLVNQIRDGSQVPYDVLSGFISYLQNNNNISSLTLKQWVVTAKNFLEYHDIDINPRRFKLKVKLPKVVKKEKEALDKEDIIETINACSDIRLKTYVMLLAASGLRALEALSVRICDVNFDTNPVKVFIRGEYTKTRLDRFVYLTDEAAKQLETWLQYKYRTRRVCHVDKAKHTTVTEYRTPTKNSTDLIFSVYQHKVQNLKFIYNDLNINFGKMLDRIGKGNKDYSGGNGKHRSITFHSFRRFVKTTISDLGYQDYSEWFISHSGSTYWRKKESEKAEMFKKIEPYLTFLDFVKLERKGADIETKLTEKEKEIQLLRQRDTINTDAIANLSDQVMKLMLEVKQVKQKQKNQVDA